MQSSGKYKFDKGFFIVFIFLYYIFIDITKRFNKVNLTLYIVECSCKEVCQPAYNRICAVWKVLISIAQKCL